MTKKLFTKPLPWPLLAIAVSVVMAVAAALVAHAYASGEMQARIVAGENKDTWQDIRDASMEVREDNHYTILNRKLDQVLDGNAHLKAMLQLHMEIEDSITLTQGDSDELSNDPTNPYLYRDIADADLFDDSRLSELGTDPAAERRP